MDLRNIIVLLNLLFGAQGSSAQSPAPALRYQPEHYVCFRAARPLNIDGKIEEKDWAQVPWTADFTDIEGDKKPQPFYRTRAKILWDDTYLYIAAELEEGNLWATYDQHDAIIFHENNFEVFIDPDGDTHNYYVPRSHRRRRRYWVRTSPAWLKRSRPM